MQDQENMIDDPSCKIGISRPEPVPVEQIKNVQELLTSYGFIMPFSPSVAIELRKGRWDEYKDGPFDHMLIKIRYQVSSWNPPTHPRCPRGVATAGIDLCFPLTACPLLAQGSSVPVKYVPNLIAGSCELQGGCELKGMVTK